MQTHYRFVLALTAEDCASLGQFEITPDWQPLFAAVALSALRAGADTLPPDDAPASIVPVWDSEHGEPHVAAVDVARDGHSATAQIRYFRRAAQDLASKLVEDQKLADGAKFNYTLLAFEAPEPERAATQRFSITSLPAALPFVDADFAELTACSTADGVIDEENFPVFIEPHVLEEARELTVAATGIETGGVLIGHLLRDQTTRDIGLRITAQIPAQNAPATAAKLTFTPETWAGVRAAIALRGRGELCLATWHSHPAIAWCAKCPPERRRECALRHPFFSEDDVLLHRVAFSAAYCVGLVITHALDGMYHGLFGWQAGLIEARGFYLLGHAPALTTNPETHHAPHCTTAT